MKKTTLLLLSIFASAQIYAQQYSYAGTSQIGNAFPFSNTTNNFRQAIFKPENFATMPSGTITAIYLQASTSVTPNITDLTVKMGETTLDIFPNNTYVTGLTTVYSGPYNQATVIGNYIKITLQTPYTYNHTKNFVLELSQSGYSTGFTLMQASIDVDNRTIFGSRTATSGTIQHRLPAIGFDITPLLSTSEVGAQKNITIYPNPAVEQLNIANMTDNSEFSIYNTTGQKVMTGKIKDQKINVAQLKNGVYTISVATKEDGIKTSKFIKK